MKNVLEISHVSKQFKRKGSKFYALKDISLKIEEGEIFAILGPNGAGKTTLLNIILGLLYPDSGQIKIFGKNLGDKDVVKQLGYVSGDERFHWALTTYDILDFGGRLYGVPRQERQQTITELVKLFGLEHVLKSKFDMLSTGEKMRLAFAYALVNKPKLLLLDEPTLGLDPDIAIRIRKEIKRINKVFKTTIVLTSHYMKEVEELSDRLVFIDRGKIIDSGTIASIKTRFPDLESYFVKMVDEGNAIETANMRR